MTYHELSTRSVLVTGVSGAIGSQIAARFGECGARVVGTYRSRRQEAEDALADIPNERRALFRAELDDPSAARRLWAKANQWYPLDTLVLNAATMVPAPLLGDDDDVWDESWQRTFELNVRGAAALMRAAAKSFTERRRGSVIVISSWAAEQGSRIPEASAYAASKAAIRNLVHTLARATARTGVRVYAIAPGVVDGGMGTEGLSKQEVATVAEGLAMGRLVGANEIAELALFLATDRCPSLTGSTMDLNGASYLR